MKRAVAAVCIVAVLGSAHARAASETPVERVVNLLKDIKGKLEMDEKKEQQIYDKYACWCEKTTERKAGSITDAQEDLRAFGQRILSLKGRVATLAGEIEQLTLGIKENKQAQEEATAIREKENAAYMGETAEMKQAIAALQQAVTVLVDGTMKKSSLLQEQARAQSAVRAVVDALPANAAMKPDHMSFLAEFLQAGTDAKYMPQSFTVQGILTDMYDTFAADLETATLDEATANTKFEKFIAVKTVELKDMEADKAKKEGEKADAEVQLADTQQMYDDTAAQKEADIAFFDETKAACETKHEAWTTRSSLREEEIAGVAKALEILTSDEARELFASAIKEGKETGTSDKYDTGRDIVAAPAAAAAAAASFLQQQQQLLTRRRGGALEAPARAYAALKARAAEAHSLRLAVLAVQVREAKVGHFDKVLVSIDEMVQTLKDEDAADIAKRDQCKNEYQEIESTVKDVEWKIRKNVAKIDKLTKLIELRTAQREKTIQEINDVDAHMKELTKVREAENDEFLDAKKEDQDAIDLLMAARDALASYYSNHSVAMGPIQGSVKGAALAQQPEFDVSADQAPDAAFSGEGKRKHESKGILQIMTMIIEDLNDEIKNGMKDEEEAQLQFEKQMAAAKKLRDDLVNKKVSLKEAISKRGQEKSDEAKDKKENEDELKDETDYKANITPDCDWIIGAFSKRAAARAAELNGLAGAKEFLAGYQPPAEASLLESSEKMGAAFDDAALSKARFLGMGR